MRTDRRKALAEADELAAAALDRARLALRLQGSPRPSRPDAARQFKHQPLPRRKPRREWLAWLRQQPEVVTISLCLVFCMAGNLHG